MARFDRYMLSQFMTLFGFFSLILVAVYWVNRAVSLFDQIIGGGQSAMVFLELSALSLPNVIRIVLPISAFAATIYVTNRLSSESELVVMQATGFSPFRLARPVVYFGLVVGLILAILAHWLVPASRTQYAARSNEIAQNVTAGLLREGRFLHPDDGITLYIREIPPSGELRDIFLSDSRSEATHTVYTARKALIVKGENGPRLIMLDGMAQSHSTRDNRLSVTRFADLSYDLGNFLAEPGMAKRDVRQLPTLELLNPSDALMEEARTGAAGFSQEFHSRLAMPLLAPVASLIGFATLLLGAFSRFGLWRQVLVAILMLVVIQFLDNAAQGIALRDARFWPVNYVPALAGLGMACGMLWWSGRERRRPRSARPAGVAA